MEKQSEGAETAELKAKLSEAMKRVEKAPRPETGEMVSELERMLEKIVPASRDGEKTENENAATEEVSAAAEEEDSETENESAASGKESARAKEESIQAEMQPDFSAAKDLKAAVAESIAAAEKPVEKAEKPVEKAEKAENGDSVGDDAEVPKESRRRHEAGVGEDGEFSTKALKTWIICAAVAVIICMAAVGVAASMARSRDSRAAAVLDVDSAVSMQFLLNRKGTVIGFGEGGDAESVNEYSGASLEKAIAMIFDTLEKEDRLTGDDAVLIGVRAAENGMPVDLQKLADEAALHAKTELRARKAGAAAYVSTVEKDEELEADAEEHGISLVKAAFVRSLIDKNVRLKLRDEKRLSDLSAGELSGELERKKYETTFEVIPPQIY